MAKKFITDLPLDARYEFCRVLDANRRWKELGTYMYIDSTTMALISDSAQQFKSPTDEILNLWSERNVTIKELFRILVKMDHQRGMTILLPFVDQKYAKYIREGRALSASSEKKFSVKDLPKPSIFKNILSKQSSDSHGSHLPSETSSSSPSSSSNVEELPLDSTATDLINFTDTFSSLSVQPNKAHFESETTSQCSIAQQPTS